MFIPIMALTMFILIVVFFMLMCIVIINRNFVYYNRRTELLITRVDGLENLMKTEFKNLIINLKK